MHPPEMSNLRATATEVGNHSKKFVYVYDATSLLNSLAFGSEYQFFLWFDLTFRQDPGIVSFALDDCDSCLGATAKVEREERKRRLPARPIEVKLKANRQSNEQMRADLNAELEAAERRREFYELALHYVIEQKFAWQQEQEAWERRYDPLGFYGPPNYKTHPDD